MSDTNDRHGQTFYFTFGCGHVLSRHVQPIRARNWNDARLKMLEMYGDKWSSQYDRVEWKRVSEKYGPYEPLPTASVNEYEAASLEERIGR